MKCEDWDWVDTLRKCKKCKGEVHQHFGDEYDNGDYWLYCHCHNCGENYTVDEFEELEVMNG